MQLAGGEKISHLSNKSKIKWSKTNYLHMKQIICISLLLQIFNRFTMTGNNNFYKAIWKNGNKEYNEKYICCFFTIWNLKSAITYKCGRVVVSRTSVYFAISWFILFVSYSFHIPCIDFMFFSCTMYYVYFYNVRFMFPFLFNRSHSKPNVVNQMGHLFLKLKNIFLLFPAFSKWSYLQRCFDVDQRCETRR